MLKIVPNASARPGLVLHAWKVGGGACHGGPERRRYSGPSSARISWHSLMPTRARRVSKQVARMRRSEMRVGASAGDRYAAGSSGCARCGLRAGGEFRQRDGRRPIYSSSSGCSSGGVSPSSPLSSSSSVMRSPVTSVSSAPRCRAGADERRGFRLGLVDLHIFLQRMNELFLEIVRRYGGFSDLAQRHDRVLVVVAIQQ